MKLSSQSHDSSRKQPNNLETAQNLLRATLDATLDMIQVFEAVRDEKGVIVDFVWILNNHTSEKMYGDVVGKSLLQTQPGVMQEGIFEAFKQVVETGEPQQYEKHYVHEQFDGWFYQSVVKVNDGVATTTADITLRKAAEKQLQHNQAFLQSVIDSSLDVIQVFRAVRDDAGKILDFVWVMNNQKAVVQNGQVISKSLLELNPGVVTTGIFEHMVQVAQTGVAYEHEQYYHHEQFDGWFYQALVKTDDGVAMTTRDITRQKKAEQEVLRLKDEAVQQVTDKYRTLFNTIDEGYCIAEVQLNENGKVNDLIFREINRAWEEKTGIPLPLNRRVSKLLPNLKEHWLPYFEEVFKTGIPIRRESYMQDVERWFSAHYSLVGELGSPLIAAIFDDITERKQQEEVLRISEEKYRTLFNSMDEIFQINELIYDEQGKIIDYRYIETNHTFEKVTGLKNVAGKLGSELGLKIEEKWYDVADKVARTGEAVRFEEYNKLLDSWWTAFIYKVSDAGTRIAVLSSDITERKHREQQQAFLLKLSDALRTIADPITLQFRAAQILGEHLGAQRVAYAGIDDADYIIERDWTNGTFSFAGRHLIASFPQVVYQSLTSGQSFCSPNVPQETHFSASEIEIYNALDIKAFAGIPLIKGNQLIAVFIVTYSIVHEWQRTEIVLMEETAERTWSAVERTRAQEGLRKSEEKYRTLFDSIDEGFGIIEMLYNEDDKPIDYLFHEANSRYERYTGQVNPSGKLGSEVSPNIEQYWLDTYDKVVKTGESIRHESYHADTERWYSAFASRIGIEGSHMVAIVFDDITERKRNEQEQELLLILSDKVRPLTDPAAIEGEVTHVLRKHFDAGWCYYVEWDENTKIGVVRRDATAQGLTSLVGEHDVSDVPDFLGLLKANPLLHVTDYENYEMLTPELRQRYTSLGFRSMLVATLVKQERLVASLLIGENKIRHWSSHEQALLMQVAERTWAAVERAKAEEALRESEERQAFLLQLSDALRPLSDPTEIQQVAMQLLGQRLGVNRAQYYLADETGEYLSSGGGYTDGVPAAVGRFHLIEFGKYAYDGFHARQTQVVADATIDPRITETVLKSYKEVGFLAYIGVPFFQRGRLIGTVAVHQSGPRQWTNNERIMVEETAERAGIAVESARAEKALRQSQKRFESIANLVPDLLWDSEPDGSTNWYNDRWLQYTGQTFEQAIGWGWTDAIHPDDREGSAKRYGEAVETGKLLRQEHRIRRHDGEYRWFVVSASPVKDKSGQVIKMYCAATDIHDIKRLETGLLDADRRKDEFLATLAHELRNPISTLRNGLSVLRITHRTDSEVSELVRMMDNQTTHLVRMIDDLLDVSRVSNGKIELKPERLELGKLLDDTVKSIRPQYESRRKILHAPLTSPPLFVQADATRLSQAITNLLTNSLRYTSDDGQVWVSLETQQNEALIRVRDNGIGLTAEQQTSVFDLFVQADNSLARTQGGLGVGLTLVKRIIEMHGGTVSAKSPGIGLGSEFTIFLPIIELPDHKTEEASEAAVKPSALKILLIDDMEDLAKLTSMLLKLRGYLVDICFNGQSGIEAVETFKPGVVLCDIGMPGLDGYQTALQIRKGEWGSRVTLIALSGYGQPKDKQRAKDAGFDGHLTKPVDIDELQNFLADVSGLK